jgi:hypothetical protein
MRFLALLLHLVGLAACNEKDGATVIGCQQLAERSVKWQEPKVALWSYQGTTKGYHYFHFVDLPVGHYEQYRFLKKNCTLLLHFLLRLIKISGAYCLGDLPSTKRKKRGSPTILHAPPSIRPITGSLHSIRNVTMLLAVFITNCQVSEGERLDQR